MFTLGPSARNASSRSCVSEGPSSLTGYATIAGNPAIFSIVSTPYGDGINCAAQSAGVRAEIRKQVPARAVDDYRFKFNITAINLDDAASVGLFDSVGTGGVIFLVPRRELAADPPGANRPQLLVKQNSVTAAVSLYMGASPLAANVWYEFRVQIVATVLSYSMTRLSDSVVVASGVVPGSWSPIAVRDVNFSADAGGLTCPVQYTGLVYCGT